MKVFKRQSVQCQLKVITCGVWHISLTSLSRLSFSPFSLIGCRPADLSLSGYPDVPLLTPYGSWVCEWSESRLQFTYRSTGGGSEGRSICSVENFKRRSSFSGYLGYVHSHSLFCFVHLDEHTDTVFAVHTSGGRYDYLTMSGREHIVRLTEAGSETQILSHIQVSFSEGLAKPSD